MPRGALVPCHLAHSCLILTGICSGKRAPSSAPCWKNHGVSRVPFQWTFPSPTPGFGACVNYCSLSCERNNLRKKVFIWAHNLRVWFIMVGAMVAGVGHIESITKREREMSVGVHLASSLCPCYSFWDHSTLDEAAYIRGGSSQ